MDTTSNTKRIAKNTLLLYVRMIFLMLVALYTSRVVLNALGVVDYGIYMAVGGFVAMFGLVSNTLTTAVSRFITFELGCDGGGRIRDIFSAALYIQFVIAVLVLVLLESFGVWFLNARMVIPPDRLMTANWVFQCSMLTFVINLVSIPYNACIIAHEHMKAFAGIGIVQALASLAVAFLIRISEADKLLLYALLMTAVAVLVRMLYGWYCSRNFSECRFDRGYDRSILRELFRFAGWNFIGASSGVLRDQGVNVLLNLFCGPAVNTARGVAMQVSAAVTQCSGNFLMALNPQITKSYAADERSFAFRLVFQGARFSVYLLLLLSLPVLAETHAVLRLWLHIVPDYSVVFVRLILIYVLAESISYTLITLMLATGNIRTYQILVGGFQLLNFPAAYVLLRMGCSPESTVVVAIVIACVCLLLRLCLLRRLVAFPVGLFVRKVLLNVAVVSCISAIAPLAVVLVMAEGLPRLFATTAATLLGTGLTVFFIGCNRRERAFIREKVAAGIKYRFA